MKKMPVILTFDIDGETLWRCRDPKNAERPVILSQGQYGPETAMPRILKLLRRHGVHATFFIPGFTAEEYPDMVREIAAQGHDIGNHSWSHTYPDNMDHLMKTPASVWPDAESYLTIYFSGVLGLMLYNIGAAIWQAVGDSRYPFLCLAICAVTNTGLDLL